MPCANRALVWQELKAAAESSPDKPFLYYGEQSISFKELDQKTDRLAYSFLQLGIGLGDNIAVITLNQPEWLYTYFAAAKIGAAVVALNVRYRDSELDYMLKNSRAKALICVKEFGEMNYPDFFRGFKEKVPGVDHYVFVGGEGFAGSLNFESLIRENLNSVQLEDLQAAMNKVEEKDTVVIIYTSGTTGRPKGAMITHKSILGSALAQTRHFKFCEDDIMIGCLPLNHVGGITCTIMASLLAKGSVVLIPTFRPDWALEAMEKYKATIFGGVPTMYVMLVNYPESSKNKASSLRLCIVGGSNVEPKVCRDIEETFPSGRIMNLYGLSETSGACVLSHLEDGVDKIATSVGVVIGDFAVRVLDSLSKKNVYPRRIPACSINARDSSLFLG